MPTAKLTADTITPQQVRDALARRLIDRKTHDNATNAMLSDHPLQVDARQRCPDAINAARAQEGE